MKHLFKIVCSALICGAFFIPFSSFAVESTVTTDSLGIEEIPVISEEKRITDSDLDALETADNGENRGVPKGNGSLIEDVSDCDVNRQFITVKSKGGNVFYIIIDKDSNSENVYFLNAVDEYDLLAFADNFPDDVPKKEKSADSKTEKTEENSSGKTDSSEESPESTDVTDGENLQAQGANKSKSIIIFIAVAGIGGVVYFKVIKPKSGGKSAKKSVYPDDEDEEYEDEETVSEDDEQEDE